MKSPSRRPRAGPTRTARSRARRSSGPSAAGCAGAFGSLVWAISPAVKAGGAVPSTKTAASPSQPRTSPLRSRPVTLRRRSSSWSAPGMPLCESWSRVRSSLGPRSGHAAASQAPAGSPSSSSDSVLSSAPGSVNAATSTLALSAVTESVAAIGWESPPPSRGSSASACSGSTSLASSAAAIRPAGSKKAEPRASSGSAATRSSYSSLSASDSPCEASTATLNAISVPTTSARSSTTPAANPCGTET